MKALLFSILIAFSVTAFAQEEVKSFRGWEWGKAFSEVSDQLEPVKTRTTRGFKPYGKINEELVFEGIKVDNIIYLFKKEKFVAATVAMHNDNLDKIVKIFEGKYGKAKYTDAFILKNYEWHIPTATVVVTMTPSASNGIGCLVQIEGK